MEREERFNILSPHFDALSLLNESNNVVFDPIKDRFYSALLDSISEEALHRKIWELRDSRLSIGRLSHARFLLPWSFQPVSSFSDESSTNTESPSIVRRNRLKNDLHIFVERSKGEAELSKRLLELRLTGYTVTRNGCYNFLRLAYAADRYITANVRTSSGNTCVQYRGRLMFFDRDSNVILSDVKVEEGGNLPFIYISGSNVVSFLCD
ncbi:LSM domain family protein [Babesia bovis T2Bo]|uniref:LSM domain family protein n=1 Tax=Babesia bovis T2Bo TaxID=484906 RepID=UPI001C35DD1E|nr:LSM domain family protein [Babesia bovis T2Bo]EDO08540.2 LSM domain family protein [Babesia bovis T2Bo]